MIIRFTDKDLDDNQFFPEGEHEVYIKTINQEQSKKGNQMLVVVLADKMGREEKEFFPLGDTALWKLASFAKATGLTKEELKSSGLNVPSLPGRKLLLVKSMSGVEMVDNKERKRYEKAYLPSKLQTQTQNASSDNFPF